MIDVPFPHRVSGRPLVCGDKMIDRAIRNLRALYPQGQVPGFPLEHGPNEPRHLGVAGIAGQTRRKPRQHRRSIAR
jgi:hypothetical protein